MIYRQLLKDKFDYFTSFTNEDSSYECPAYGSRSYVLKLK